MDVYLLYFIIYSFVGWIIESLFRSLIEKGQPVNSGFLTGPFIPVYGFGALIFIVLGIHLSSLPFAFQLLSFTLLATVLEYTASVILEKIFKLKLWDYSNFPIHDAYHINFPLNINGRVCLLFSIFWAGLISFQIYVLQPFFSGIVSKIGTNTRYIILFVFFIYIIVDLYFSTRLYLGFSSFLESVRKLQSGKVSVELTSRIKFVSNSRIFKTFMRPLRSFPHLRDLLSSAWDKVPGGTHIPYLNDIRKIVKEKLPVLKSSKKTPNLQEFFSIAAPVIKHPDYQKLKEIKHHDKDIYTHNLSVAWISFLLAKKFNLHVIEVVRGALLHDFFFYDWRTFRDRDYILPHGFTHPTISYKNAVKTYGSLTPREKDIILKHMWPLTVVPPLYRESFLVSMVDKAIAGKEAVKAVIPGKNKTNKQKE